MPGGFTGHIMMLIMLLMYTTATQKVRNQCFEVFWYTHHLAFFFMLGLYTHATGCFVRGACQIPFFHHLMAVKVLCLANPYNVMATIP